MTGAAQRNGKETVTVSSRVGLTNTHPSFDTLLT